MKEISKVPWKKRRIIIVIRHIVKKRIIEDIGNNATNSLIDGDPFSLVSSSYSIMGNRSIDEFPNR